MCVAAYFPPMSESVHLQWEQGEVDGWQNQDSPVCDVDLSVFDTAADLEVGCDIETIKQQLQKMGLKTGKLLW